MGIDFGGLADKAKGLVNEHGDKIEAGVEKAGEFAKEKFGHGDKIDQAVDKVKDFVPGEYGDDAPQADNRQGNAPQGDVAQGANQQGQPHQQG